MKEREALELAGARGLRMILNTGAGCILNTRCATHKSMFLRRLQG
jgi:hypothetical protein